MRQILSEIEDLARADGLAIFPGFPDDCPTARWPDAERPEDFVEMAVRVGAPLLYLAGLDAEQMAPMEHVDLESHPQVDPGGLVTVVAGWMAGSVLHILTVTDPAWEKVVEQATTEADVARFREQLEAHEAEEFVEGAARDVVTDRAFWDHGSQGRDAAKLGAIERLRPDVPEHLRFRVLLRANKIDRIEYKPSREEAWAQRAREMIADGQTKRAAATEIGISVNVLNRVLETNPPR